MVLLASHISDLNLSEHLVAEYNILYEKTPEIVETQKSTGPPERRASPVPWTKAVFSNAVCRTNPSLKG